MAVIKTMRASSAAAANAPPAIAPDGGAGSGPLGEGPGALAGPDPARDNVELALALRELGAARVALERLALRTRLLAEAIGDGVVVLDESGRVATVNAAALALLGGSEAALRRWLWDDAPPAGPEGLRPPNPVVSTLLDGRPRNLVELPAPAAAGERWLAVSARALVDPASGRVEAVVCTLVDVTARRAREAELERQATVDALTGLFNRHYLERRLAAEASRARRARLPLAVALADLDRFKRINDRHGHAAGDAALQHFARILRDALRVEDVVARLGGDEFCVLLPGTPPQQAVAPLARVLQRLGAVAVTGPTRGFRVAASFGVAGLRPGEDPAALLARADQALYAAKSAGRGRVACAPNDG